MTDPLDEMVAHVYEAVLDPGLRQATLDRLTDLLGANTCVQHVSGTVDAPGFTASSNVDPGAAARYQEHYYSVDPWLARAGELPGPGIVICSEILSQREFERSEFYADFLRAQELYWGASLLVECGEGGASYVSPMRARSLGDFSPGELQLLQRLLPHVQLSIKLQRKLQLAESRRSLLESTLSSLQCGILVLDAQGRLVFANAAADAITGNGACLTLKGGKLRARNPATDRRLNTLIDAAGKLSLPLAARPAGAVTVERGPGLASLEVLVAPFGGSLAGHGRAGAAVLVLLSDEPSTGDHRAVLLRQTWGLTAKEADCALVLAEGCSVSDAAERLGSRPNTIRAHVRSLLQKTGTKRQGALIALIHRQLALLGILASTGHQATGKLPVA